MGTSVSLWFLVKDNPEILIDKEDLIKFSFCTAFIKDNYVFVNIDGERELLHRLIMGIPDCFVDHKSRNTLDNRKENLRLCNNQQNCFNQGLSTNNTSGYKGVTYRKDNKLWRARITVNGKKKSLGNFDTKEEAAERYNQAAIKHHGEFASLNELP